MAAISRNDVIGGSSIMKEMAKIMAASSAA